MTEYDGLAYLKSSTLSADLYDEAERIRLELQKVIDVLSPKQPFVVSYHNAQHVDWQYKFSTNFSDGTEYYRLSPSMDIVFRARYSEPGFVQRTTESVIGGFDMTKCYSRAIRVWRFEDAPEAYLKLSTNGGDEDWIAFVPESMVKTCVPWMEEGSLFGCSCVDEFVVEGGVVRIGSHA